MEITNGVTESVEISDGILDNLMMIFTPDTDVHGWARLFFEEKELIKSI